MLWDGDLLFFFVLFFTEFEVLSSPADWIEDENKVAKREADSSI